MRAPTRRRRSGTRQERGRAAPGWSQSRKGLLRDIGWLIGLALFVEVSFQLPGLGRTMQLAIFSADTPLIESVLIFATLVAVGIHLLGTLIGGAVSAKWRAGA